MNEITNEQQNAAEMLRGIRPLPRLVIGLGACAVAALYIPLVMVALTGRWINNLIMWDANAVALAVLVVQNLIGNKIKRVHATGLCFALLIACYYGQFVARTSTLENWKEWWPLFFVPLVGCPLNAFLLTKYKKVAAL